MLLHNLVHNLHIISAIVRQLQIVMYGLLCIYQYLSKLRLPRQGRCLVRELLGGVQVRVPTIVGTGRDLLTEGASETCHHRLAELVACICITESMKAMSCVVQWKTLYGPKLFHTSRTNVHSMNDEL